jgi:hypothetical protein
MDMIPRPIPINDIPVPIHIPKTDSSIPANTTYGTIGKNTRMATNNITIIAARIDLNELDLIECSSQ